MANQIQIQSIEEEAFLQIRRGRFDKLTIYEISESELTLLERGSPDSTYLNFAIFLLSTAVSFTITLLTTTISLDRTYILFVISTIIGYIGGVFFLLLWRRSRQSITEVVGTIRRRLPSEANKLEIWKAMTQGISHPKDL